MHENIKKLAEQAELNLELQSLKVEKFAELIAKECANLFNLTYTDEQYARRIDKTILKHFGLYPE